MTITPHETHDSLGIRSRRSGKALPQTLSGNLSGAAVVALLVLGSLFIALPPIWARHLPLWDAGGHIARISMLNGALLHGRDISAYAPAPFWLPNVAFDIIGIGLAQFMNAEIAGRIFLAISQILTFLGVVLLNRVLIGRWSLFAFAVGLFVYNLVTAYGFLNYIFGVGLAFFLLAIRVHLLRTRPRLGLAIGAAIGVVMLFAHLSALGIYAVLWAGIACDDLIHRKVDLRSAALRGLEFIPAFLLLLSMRTGQIFDYHYYNGVIVYKTQYLLRVLMSAAPWGDVALVIALILLAVIFLFRSRIRLVSMLPGVLALFVIYWIMPSRLQTSWFADVRLPITIVFALLAGLDVRVREFPGRSAVVVAIALTFLAKQVAIAQYWHQLEQPIDEVIGTIDHLPTDAVILDADCVTEAYGSFDKLYARYAPPQHHIMELSALTTVPRFYGSYWAEPAAQPLRVKPAYQPFYDMSMDFGKNERCDLYGPRSMIAIIQRKTEAQAAMGNVHSHVYFMAWHEYRPVDVSPYGHFVKSIGIGNLYQVDLP